MTRRPRWQRYLAGLVARNAWAASWRDTERAGRATIIWPGKRAISGLLRTVDSNQASAVSPRLLRQIAVELDAYPYGKRSAILGGTMQLPSMSELADHPQTEDVDMQVEEPPIVSFHAAAPGGEVNIRIASTAERHAAASLLLRKMYAWRGYAFDVASAAASNKVTFYAETDGILVGTMSVWFDRHGELPADASYGDHLALLRRQGRRLCEPSRLAIDAGLCKRVFAGLIHVSYIYAHHLQGFSDYVIEVNPRHVGFYRRMLGFSELGGERACARVGAPAVLLRLPLEHMGAEIRRCGGTMEQSGERSFYPYFFPVRDEPGIIARLTADSAQGDAA